MKIGDVYRDNTALLSENQLRTSRDEYGFGPFVITRVEQSYVYTKSLEDGRCFGPWSHPRNWGVLDTFLTAAYNALEQDGKGT